MKSSGRSCRPDPRGGGSRPDSRREQLEVLVGRLLLLERPVGHGSASTISQAALSNSTCGIFAACSRAWRITTCCRSGGHFAECLSTASANSRMRCPPWAILPRFSITGAATTRAAAMVLRIQTWGDSSIGGPEGTRFAGLFVRCRRVTYSLRSDLDRPNLTAPGDQKRPPRATRRLDAVPLRTARTGTGRAGLDRTDSSVGRCRALAFVRSSAQAKARPGSVVPVAGLRGRCGSIEAKIRRPRPRCRTRRRRPRGPGRPLASSFDEAALNVNRRPLVLALDAGR